MSRGHMQDFPVFQGRCIVPSVSVPANPDVSDAPGSTVISIAWEAMSLVIESL